MTRAAHTKEKIQDRATARITLTSHF